jgi:uncharacterized membrane protein
MIDSPICQPRPYRSGTTVVPRWASLGLVAAAVAFGWRRRTLSGVFLAIAAVPLAYRGWVGSWPRLRPIADDTRVALAGDRGIHVRESVRLEQPLADVYRFWRQLENLPRFMTHLESVADLGNGRSHWVARGPAGTLVEWDAEMINEVENKVIGWRSLPGADVVTAGSVTFTPVRGDRSTEVAVHLQYAPPAGRVGALVATLAGREPSRTIREDLRRFKQLLEAGEIARSSRSM